MAVEMLLRQLRGFSIIASLVIANLGRIKTEFSTTSIIYEFVR